VGEYIPTTSTINSAPRFDHNPTTGESLGLLVEEQRTNLLLQSNGFDTTWTNSNSSETATAGIAPDGTNTAWELRDTLDASATNHSITQTITFTSGTAYAFSVFAKRSTLESIALVFPAAMLGTATIGIKANLTNGTIIVTAAGATNSITAYPNGWYRVTSTMTATASGTSAMQIRTAPLSGAGTGYQGDGTGTILIWGAQLEAGAFTTSYIPTTTATVTRAADVASITEANFGTTRTNLLLQSNQFDTTWTNTNSSETAASGTAPDGTNTAWELKDTSDVSAQPHSVNQTISFTSGTAYTFTCWFKSGTLSFAALTLPAAAFTSILIGRFDLTNETVASASPGATCTINSFPNGWYRCSVSATATANASAGIAIRTSNSVGSSYAGNGTGTILIWGAQLETGTSATAYIPTTTAAVSVFDSSWYRQDEGTVFAEYTGVIAGVNRGVWALTADSSNANNIIDFFNGGVSPVLRVNSSGVNQAYISTGIATTATFNKVASAFAQNNFARSLNGLAANLDTSGTMPATTPILLNIGTIDAYGVASLSGTIRRLTYWPQRLPNSTLQTITQ